MHLDLRFSAAVPADVGARFSVKLNRQAQVVPLRGDGFSDADHHRLVFAVPAGTKALELEVALEAAAPNARSTDEVLISLDSLDITFPSEPERGPATRG